MKLKLVLGVAVAALLVGGYATYSWAAGSAEAQTINACVNTEGNVRLVAVSDACKKNETAVSWNTVGPAGPQGLQGPTGAQGPQGAAAPDPDAIAGTAAITIQGQPLAGIALKGLNQGLSVATSSVGGGGAVVGRRTYKPFVFTKKIDVSSPVLLKAIAEGRALSTALFTLQEGGQTVETIKLTNARLTDLDQHGTTETWSMTFQKIEWTVDGVSFEDDPFNEK
jgi:Type VI secretion system effector, Hcp